MNTAGSQTSSSAGANLKSRQTTSEGVDAASVASASRRAPSHATETRAVHSPGVSVVRSLRGSRGTVPPSSSGALMWLVRPRCHHVVVECEDDSGGAISQLQLRKEVV